jgi:hypothetical protein
MATAGDGVSDPQSPNYDPRSPFYDVTADPSSKYYVGPLASDARSGNELREQAAKEIDDEIAQGWFGKAVDPAFKDKKVQELYERNLEDARQGLDEGLSIRQTGGAPKTLWANASHEQMNAAISQNANSATIGETSEEWVTVGNELATHQETLATAITKSGGNWQGEAGDAVREHLAGVGKWLGATAQGATLTGRQQQVHSQTLNETQKAMAANPPVAFSVQEANARLQQVTNPVEYAAQASQDMAQYRAQQAARGHAAQIMTQFDETIGAAVATPQFPAPPKLPGASSASMARRPGGGGAGAGTAAQPLMARDGLQPTVPGVPVGDPSTVDGGKAAALGTGGPGGGAPGIPDGSGGSGGSGSGFGGSGSGGPGGSGGFTPPPLNVPDGPSGGLPSGGFTGAGVPGVTVPDFNDSTTTSGFTPAASNSPTGGMPTGGMPGLNVPDMPGGGNTVRPGTSFTPPPITVPDMPGGGPMGVPGGSGTGTPPTIGRMGGINGDSIASRLGGGGGLGAGGSGTGGGTAGPRLTGGSLAPGGAAGAAAEAEAMAARNAAGTAGGTRGAAGTPGMGGMGAGAKGGKGEEDKEHRLADYIENDDPDAFAPDEVVAPPVIGDWTNTDWK